MVFKKMYSSAPVAFMDKRKSFVGLIKIGIPLAGICRTTLCRSTYFELGLTDDY
jgi:hypothetical protein